jgi:hypothetical protein
MESHVQLREAVVNLERRAVDAERTHKIAELCERYQETGVFDREELLETCLYSRGASISQEDFASRLVSLEGVAKRVTSRSPVNQRMIPDGVTAQEANETERYEMVMDRFSELKRQGKGKGLSFDVVEDQLIADGKLAAVR